MEKKMVHGLPIPLTHTTPIDHNNMLLPKVVHCKEFSYGRQPNKKSLSKEPWIVKYSFMEKECRDIVK
jgi:hypothetical protein